MPLSTPRVFGFKGPLAFELLAWGNTIVNLGFHVDFKTIQITGSFPFIITIQYINIYDC